MTAFVFVLSAIGTAAAILLYSLLAIVRIAKNRLGKTERHRNGSRHFTP